MASAITAAAAVTGAIHGLNRRSPRVRAAASGLGSSPEAGGSRGGPSSRSVAASARVAALILSSTVFTLPP
jgi:hypothetical protein